MLSLPLLMTLVLLPRAEAGDGDLARDLRGVWVQAEEAGTVLLFFSMADADAPMKLRTLAERHREGQPVLAVNVDFPTERARLLPFLSGLGLRALPAAHDPTRALCQQLAVRCSDAALVQYDQGVRVTWQGADPADAPRPQREPVYDDRLAQR